MRHDVSESHGVYVPITDVPLVSLAAPVNFTSLLGNRGFLDKARDKILPCARTIEAAGEWLTYLAMQLTQYHCSREFLVQWRGVNDSENKRAPLKIA